MHYVPTNVTPVFGCVDLLIKTKGEPAIHGVKGISTADQNDLGFGKGSVDVILWGIVYRDGEANHIAACVQEALSLGLLC